MRTAGSLSTRGVQVVPDGWHSITPRIIVHEPEKFVAFLRSVFGAAGEYRSDRPTVVQIGDSMIMVSEAGVRSPATAFLYVYVEDVGSTFRRAVDAAARVLEEPLDTPYGDRRCMVEDSWGNTWQVATIGKLR